MRNRVAASVLVLGMTMASQAGAALKFDTQGLGVNLSGSGDVITIDAFDWTQHSFLAAGGVDAIIARANTVGDCGSACDFTVYAHGTLGSATLDGTNVWSGTSVGDDQVEITYLLSFTETVTSAVPGSNAIFSVKEEDGVSFEMYWDETPDADALTGSGYNDGTVILFGDEIADATGFFLNNSNIAEDLDQTSDGNDYDGQGTLPGTGSNTTVEIGGLVQDNNFFLTSLLDFGFNFSNVSLSLPYTNVNPSDCFNGNFNGALGNSTAAGCNVSHIDGTFEQNEGDGNPAGTIVPRTGTVNGTPLGGIYGGQACLGQNGNACPDFVAQTDTNSGFQVEVPAPGTLAITGLGLILLGARRRKG